MNSVTEHFVLLLTQHEGARARGTQLLTRSLGFRIGGHEALAAIDSHGHKHLLVPMTEETPLKDDKSSGVALNVRVLRTGGQDVEYVDLACLIPELDLVFERLADDVLARLVFDGSRPMATCHNVLSEWRALLKTSTQISRETIVGLTGELEIVEILARHDPIGALAAWKGPTGALHDFTRHAEELEVKSTASTDGNYITITHMDQLDPSLAPSLHLAVVHLREDETGFGLDERIDRLISLGVARDALLTRVAEAGYMYETRLNVADRFKLRTLRLWEVDAEFPGLRRKDIPQNRLKGVSKITYDLALDTAPQPLHNEDCERYWGRWSQ